MNSTRHPSLRRPGDLTRGSYDELFDERLRDELSLLRLTRRLEHGDQALLERRITLLQTWLVLIDAQSGTVGHEQSIPR